MLMKKIALLLCWFVPLLAAAQPTTDVYLFDLSMKKDQVVLANGRNVTPHKGYDNQPFFHPQQPLMYYSSSTDSSRTDLKSYDYRTGVTRQLTATREGEFSPTLTPDGRFLSCIVQRANGQQDLAKFPLAGGAPTVLVNNLKVGYHAWIDETRLLLNVLVGTGNELHYLNLATRRDSVMARNIGRSLKRIPRQRAISFMEKQPGGSWLIKHFDTRTLAISTVAPGLPGSEDVAWTATGLLLMSDGEGIFSLRPGRGNAWQPVLMQGPATKLNKATRLAVSPANDRLAVVVSE